MRGLTEAQSSPPIDQTGLDQYRRLKPGPGRTRAVVAADQRARIQRALVELVARDGYSCLTVRKLIGLAGVSTATFYAEFSGTDDCLLSTYRDLMRGLSERVDKSRDPALPRQAQLTRSLQELVAGLTEDPHVGRLVLLDVFALGPAALGPVRACEMDIESTLRHCLDRRRDRIPTAAVSWTVAGVMHGARSTVMVRTDAARQTTAERLVRWGYASLRDGAGGEPSVDGRSKGRRTPPEPRTNLRPASRSDDTGLIMNAVAKLAATDGYWKLTMSHVSKAAGVPATRIKCHFGSIEVAFLNSVCRTVRGLIPPLTGETPDTPHPGGELCPRSEIARLLVTVSEDPPAARLMFSEIAAPGLSGVTARGEVIKELATAWRSILSSGKCPDQFEAEAAVGSLWHVIACSAEEGSLRDLVAQRERYGALFEASFKGFAGRQPQDKSRPQVAALN
jgi:AcrR family transcriptional regulator